MPDLDDSDKAIIAGLLRVLIETDKYPLSTRVTRWQEILDKLDPPAPRSERWLLAKGS